jgi:hypothetical protein
VLELVRQRFSDFGPELAREHLAAEHGFAHSTETLRGLDDPGWPVDTQETPCSTGTQPACTARLPVLLQ